MHVNPVQHHFDHTNFPGSFPTGVTGRQTVLINIFSPSRKKLASCSLYIREGQK